MLVSVGLDRLVGCFDSLWVGEFLFLWVGCGYCLMEIWCLVNLDFRFVFVAWFVDFCLLVGLVWVFVWI